MRNVAKWNLASLGRYVSNISDKADTLWGRWVNHAHLRKGNWSNCKAAAGASS